MAAQTESLRALTNDEVAKVSALLLCRLAGRCSNTNTTMQCNAMQRQHRAMLTF